MRTRVRLLLFITSFVPVVVFKIVSRGGAGTLGQAKTAILLALLLAIIQFGLSKRFLKHTTYLEKAFLVFMALGLLWIFLAPPGAAGLFALYSTAMLYFTLFLMTLLPQLFGYDPFTYALAKVWYPEAVWGMPAFRIVNFHLTYFWSAIFLVCFVASFFGHGLPVFTIVIPMALILCLGVPVAFAYPKYYVKRKFGRVDVDPTLLPHTARELVLQMPQGFDREAASGIEGDIQFLLAGEGGGELVVAMKDGQCTAYEGRSQAPLLTVRAPADIWVKMARGEMDRPKAFMQGLCTAEGDMKLLTGMGKLFHRPKGDANRPGQKDLHRTGRQEATKKREEGKMKIFAVQGSPRPKASNTELLLRQFLNGAESQGAETETVYLKEKKIHPCQGCFTCWTRTPGVCAFSDDMPELLEKVKACDVIVYATPLYVFNVTALLKAFQERLLPLLNPYLVKRGETYGHPSPFLTGKRMVLISSCGFPEVSHFDALRQVFQHLAHAAMPLVGSLLVPAAELLKQEALRPKTQPILDAAYRGGVELVRDGRVSEETEAAVQQPALPADQMAAMANLFWDSFQKGSATDAVRPGKIRDMGLLLHGMAATLNAEAAGTLSAVIQFHVTGDQPGDWFLTIENGNCTVSEGSAAVPTLTINTPSDVWLAISNKEMDGQAAFMEGKYTVQGDIGLLMRMKTLFGAV